MREDMKPLRIIGIFALSAAFVAMLFASCTKQQESEALKESEADSLLEACNKTEDYEGTIALADSLEQAGAISKLKAGFYRGCAFSMLGNARESENILKPLLAEKPKNLNDSLMYYECVISLTEIYSLGNDHENVLLTALPALDGLKSLAYHDQIAAKAYHLLMRLSCYIGKSQKGLSQESEAAKSYEMAYEYAKKMTAKDHRLNAAFNAAVIMENILISYTNRREFTMAEKWLAREDEFVGQFVALKDAPPAWVDDLKAFNYLDHASVALGLNKPDEAARAFADYQKTQKAQSCEGRIDGADFLFNAKRYAEAADAYAVLDQFFDERNMGLSLDNVGFLTGKFEINLHAGRKDSAMAVATYVFDRLDSIITVQKESDAAELATIYATQQKDAEIAQQQIKLTQQRWIATAIALLLLSIFFIIYTLNRRRHARHLAEKNVQLQRAHSELQTAYDQLEETTAQKERMASELRIARDIQMSMVPSVFPDYEGLDMYAAMTPAKEVGGDLYGYVMLGDKLYFALGDVSGKGVPASLFMAQATRLFRTLAAQQMMPAEICTRMNDALSGEDNESSMFVTFFLGLLDLKTGHLDFCNAGHNPPVIGGGDNNGDFLEMIPNAPIGLFPGLEYEGEQVASIKGRPLFIYTDGLNEAENLQQEQFGDNRLLDFLRNAQFDSAQDVIEAIKADVEQHRNGAEPNDDLTMMCIRTW